MLEEPVKAKGALIDKVGISEDDKYIVTVTDKNTDTSDATHCQCLMSIKERIKENVSGQEQKRSV